MRTDNTWLSVPKAAKLLGRSNSSVHRAILRGDLPAQQLGRSHARIAAKVISELIAGSYEAAESPARLREPKNSDTTPRRVTIYPG